MAVNHFTTKCYTSSEDETMAWGTRLASVLRTGDVVSLDGELGVGKTRLVAGIAAGFGVTRDQVTSPTFTLIHEYESVPPLAHLDAYRLADSDEFLNLGVSELWEDGVVLVEWGTRVADALPRRTLFIAGDIDADGSRVWTVTATAAEWANRWDDIVASCQA